MNSERSGRAKAVVEPTGKPLTVDTPITVVPPPAKPSLVTLQDFEVADPRWCGEYLKKGLMPLRKGDRRAFAVAEDAALYAEVIDLENNGNEVALLPATRPEMARFIEDRHREVLTEDAGKGLYKRDRLNSALHGITPLQYGICALLGVTLILGVVLAPATTLIWVTASMITVLLALVVFRFACMSAGQLRDKFHVSDDMLAALRDEDLPTYTVMVPMLRERESTLRGLVKSLSEFDYPRDKLQIQMIVEETDPQTLAVVQNLALPRWFDIVRIADADPLTKGKACNYALYFARGELATIYDAEDHPDPLQLKKAVAAFRASPDNVVCVQAHLSFYNMHENWLTRMFTLDYTVWYDFMLPGLERLNVPICLGGTSNHFLTAVVRDLDGWDAFNVTEDADLGLRFAKKGYQTIMLSSTTLEEANTRVGNWIRQRSRWMKGYMVTYLVHMRRPLALLRVLGLWRFVGVQLFVAGNFVGNLINPPLWATTLLWLSNVLWGWSDQSLFPISFWYPAMFCLIVGNTAAIGFTVLAAYKRQRYELIPYAFTMPVYWVLAAIATYKGLWQLFTRPFYWEKTDHGLTTMEMPILAARKSQ